MNVNRRLTTKSRKKSMSLWLRIFLTVYGSVIIVTLIVVMRIFTTSSEANLQREYKRALSEHQMLSQSMTSFAATISTSIRSGTKIPKSIIVTALRNYANYYMANQSYLIVRDVNGETIYSNSQKKKLPKNLKINPGDARKYVYKEEENHAYILVAGTVEIAGDFFEIHFIQDITEQMNDQRVMIQQVSLFIAAILLGLGILLFFFLNRAFKPLEQLSVKTKAIAQANYEQRAEVVHLDEVGELAMDFNQMAKAIETQVGELKKASNARDKFIANMAHELKTPLTAIIGYADLSLSKQMDEHTHAQAMHFIKKESKRLDELSRKLLSLYQITDGGLVVLEPCSISELIWQVEESVRATLSEKRQQLTTKSSLETCRVDAALFVSLLVNLINNASKASSEGAEVQLTVKEDGKMALFHVRDFGSGIATENLLHVKDPFFIADASRNSSKQNVGLGLALCEAIVQVHHGEMEIESQVDKGTSIFVRIPL